jgi:peptide/nickel transport system substrate-binding protein
MQTPPVAERRGGSERYLTTVVMTDIVGSTEHAAELGDGAWRELVQMHHNLVRTALRRHGGREVDTAGDGFFAIFDAPAAAVDCALEIASRVRELGVDVRAGVHTGEVEKIGSKVGGITVPIASRIMSAAAAGEVLVSSTVRDLSAGADLRFEDRGTRELKGVPGEWRVYSAARSNATGAEGVAGAAVAGEGAARRAAAVRRARSRPIWQRHPRLAAAAVLVVALVVAVSGLVIWKPWQQPALSFVGEDSIGVIDGGRGEIVASIKVGARPGGVVIANGFAWVTNTGADTVERIDLATRTVTREIDVGRSPTGVAAAGGSIWVANSAERTVTRINADIARVVGAPISVGSAPVAIAAGAGSLWVANAGDSTVVRIDPSTGNAGQPVPVAGGPVALAVADDGVWVASADGAAVTHLDLASGVTLAAPIALPSRPTALAVGAGAVWVSSIDGTVTRIDAQTNRVTATIDLGGSPSAIVAEGDSVWVADRQGTVARLLAANPSSAPGRIATKSSPEALAVAEGNLWVAARASAASHRGGTLRTVYEFPPVLEPTGFPLFNAALLEADGLMGYRRVGGVAGSALLADLATSIPRPTNGGRTYVFRLRPNLVYSTGQPVRAADFRRAIERSYQVKAGPIAIGNAFYGTVTGADACTTPTAAPVKRCDLSAGIVTDDAASTVTFNLSGPDPDFLYKLAIPSAYPVPEGVPMNTPIQGPFPGTGPYVVSAVSENEIRFSRNPKFRVWDPEVRPDGFPDEIVFSGGIEAEARASQIERGEADVMPLRGDNRVSQELLARLTTQYPGQLHFGSTSMLAVFMNTAQSPFDKAEVRQAINRAIDRARVADLFGGPPAVAVSCQLLPPGFPGYQPYCPYTANPDPGGRWHGPDLAGARGLIDATGTRGAKVVVGPVRAPYVRAAEYLVTVLRDLGYKASLAREPDDEKIFHAVNEGREQIGIGLFVAGILSPVEFLGLPCPPADPITHYCDAGRDTLITQARQLQTTDPAAAAAKWAEVDRMAVDQAIFAPFLNEGSDFVSARVGNYQFNPGYLVLLDQLWVQ